MIARAQIAGLVLAGGQGSRIGGRDKGMMPFHGKSLAAHAAERLAPQVGMVAINANRRLDDYAALGLPVWPDDVPGFQGPLAGMLAGLKHLSTPWLATVPCDTPRFPTDLVPRLAAALQSTPCARLAMAAVPGTDGTLQRQPVFCLLHADLHDGLQAFFDQGGRKVGQWASMHAPLLVPFDPADFTNANTVQELAALQGDC